MVEKPMESFINQNTASTSRARIAVLIHMKIGRFSVPTPAFMNLIILFGAVSCRAIDMPRMSTGSILLPGDDAEISPTVQAGPIVRRTILVFIPVGPVNGSQGGALDFHRLTCVGAFPKANVVALPNVVIVKDKVAVVALLWPPRIVMRKFLDPIFAALLEGTINFPNDYTGIVIAVWSRAIPRTGLVSTELDLATSRLLE